MKAITIFVEYEIGDVVYLKTDKEQFPRIVIHYQVTSRGVLYELQYASFSSTTHNDFEIVKEKDRIIVLD